MKKTRKKFRFRQNSNVELFIISLPAMLFLLVFNYIPMGGIIIAFKDFRYNLGIWGSRWVGFDNFRFLFQTDAFRITKNTILLNAYFIISGLVFSIIFALILYELNRKFVKVYQTIMFFPYFLSWVVVSYLFMGFFDMRNGIVNRTLINLNMDPVYWFNEPGAWPLILVVVFVWKSVGYSTILYYTSLMGIDTSYYEAAALDGASRWQQTKYISLPMLKPIITIILLLNIGRIMYQDFGMFYFLTRDTGMLYKTTDVIDTYVFRTMRVVGNIGMSTAAGLYQSTIGFVMVLVTNLIVRKFSKENALF